MPEKKIPLRRCAGCGERKPKAELVRIVRTPDGEIILDKTGRTNGRGVYLCPQKKCLDKAKKAKRPERSLESEIPEEVYAQFETRLEADE